MFYRFHEHIDEEEIYFILKGKGLVNDNGNEQEVTVGDAVLTGRWRRPFDREYRR